MPTSNLPLADVLELWRTRRRHDVSYLWHVKRVVACATAIKKTMKVEDLTPDRWREIRSRLRRKTSISSGCANHVANHRMALFLGILKWAVGEGYITYDIIGPLLCVRPLDHDPSEYRERPDIGWDLMSQVKPYLPQMTWDMIHLQYLAGMRPGEIRGLRFIEIETCHEETDGVWLYRPNQHKMAWRRIEKRIVFGARAIAVLRPYIELIEATRPSGFAAWDYLFTHRTSFVLWYHFDRFHCRTKYGRGYIDSFTRYRDDPDKCHLCDRPLTHQVFNASLCKGITLANSDGIEMPYWTAHQLRHARATVVDEQYGPQGFEAVTGDKMNMRATYVKQNHRLAVKIAQEIG